MIRRSPISCVNRISLDQASEEPVFAKFGKRSYPFAIRGLCNGNRKNVTHPVNLCEIFNLPAESHALAFEIIDVVARPGAEELCQCG